MNAATDATHALAVTGVTAHGFTLVIGGEAFRLPFNRFPWFRRARADRLSTVEWISPDHLFWPRLDVDLSVPFIRMLATVTTEGR